jgi:hypothetical protein
VPAAVPILRRGRLASRTAATPAPDQWQ